MKTYPLAPHAIFRTVQGEGALQGQPMTFVRLGGCSVGCRWCDTDFRVHSRATAEEIAARAVEVGAGLPLWLTGGEPTDHDLAPLLAALSAVRFKPICLATAGHRLLTTDERRRVDWLSVSPHDPAAWVEKAGSELKLVPWLDGFRLADFESALGGCRFEHHYVTPLDGEPASVQECLAWLETHPGWRLGVQAHKSWRLP